MNSNLLSPIFRKSTLSRRFPIITVIFLSVLLGLLVYTMTTLQKDKSNALLIDMAGRQRMLLQKHVNEVLLTSQGVPTNYASTRELIHSTLNALMAGGSVVLNPETDQRQMISAAPSQEILRKLREQQKQIEHLFQLADQFLLLSPNHLEFLPQLQALRKGHSLAIQIADEAVKQLDEYSEAMITTMVKWEVFLAIVVGLLGIFVTSKAARDGRKWEKEVEERRHAELALQNNEMFLSSIVENIPHMIFVKDAKDLQFIRWNKAGVELVGYPNKTLIGKTDYDFFPKSEADFYTQKDREVLSGKTLIDIPEEVIQTKSNGTRYLHTKKIPILDVYGHPQYLLGISEDITERKQAEEHIRKGERTFRAIYEQAPTGIATLDSLSGQFTQINQKYCDITGYEPEEMLNRTFRELTHPDDLQADLDLMQQLLSGQVRHFQMEKRYIRKNGEIIWVHLTCVPLWLESTDPRQHIAMVEDITYRKQAEKALLESEERFRILYEDNPSMYFTVAHDGKILSVNRFGAQQLGYLVEELVGELVIDLFLEDDRSQVQQRFENCLKSPLAVFSWEFRKVRKDRSIVWVKEVARAVQNKDAEIVVLIVCEDITERKETEKALQEWKALTESILGQLPKGFAYRCLNEKKWTIIYASDGIEEVTGYPVADLLSGSITYDTLMAPGENERVWPIVQDALAKGLPYENEHQIITRDGKTKWILARGRFIFDDAGQLLYLDGLNVDISEQKQIQNALRTSETRFRSLIEHIPFCIHEIGLDGTISSMNQTGQTMIGVGNEADMLGRSHLELAEAGDHERIRENFTKASQGQPVDYEFNVTTHGNTRFFTKRFIPIRGNNGKVSKIVGIWEDITERKEKEEQLKTLSDRLVLATASAKMGIWDWDIAEDVLTWDEQMFNLYGLVQKNVKVRYTTWAKTLHPEDRTRAETELQQTILGVESFHTEFRIVWPDQSVHTLQAHAVVQRNDAGTAIRIIGVNWDLTEQKNTDERLRESEVKRTEALRQSDSLKSALLSSVSHELRTPLTAMKTSVSNIIENVPSEMNEVQHEFLKGIDQEINYMSRLVDNLLDMSQIEAGTLIPHREWHPLEDLVEGALRRTEQSLETRDIQIQIPENISPAFVDAVEIQQVLINLLDNAVKYSSPDSPIRLHVRVGPQQIEVEVSNTAEPIHAQDLERIFERFYRLRSAHEQPIRGTGLGLAICKAIVEAHGGRIWAESTGKEVTITFTIPVTETMASFSLEGRHKA